MPCERSDVGLEMYTPRSMILRSEGFHTAPWNSTLAFIPLQWTSAELHTAGLRNVVSSLASNDRSATYGPSTTKQGGSTAVHVKLISRRSESKEHTAALPHNPRSISASGINLWFVLDDFEPTDARFLDASLRVLFPNSTWQCPPRSAQGPHPQNPSGEGLWAR